MANDLQKFFAGHQLPSKEKLAQSLGNFAANKRAIMGKALLRLTKQGVWIFGQDNEAISLNTLLVANPASLSSGYVAWWLGKIEGEIMQPLAQGPVNPDRLTPVKSGTIPPGKDKPSGRGWEDQYSIDFITQEETPLQLIYKVSSLGGKKALFDLAAQLQFYMEENPARMYPVIKLGTDSYMHNEYGVVYTPILEIVGWLDENGREVHEAKKIGPAGLM